VLSGDVIIYTRHYMSAESREYCSRHPAHTLRERRGGGRTEKGWSS